MQTFFKKPGSKTFVFFTMMLFLTSLNFHSCKKRDLLESNLQSENNNLKSELAKLKTQVPYSDTNKKPHIPLINRHTYKPESNNGVDKIDVTSDGKM